MTSAICTLFEGDYHYGVGALCNSLYEHGYRGVVYVGYRGPMPPWAAGAIKRDGYSELTVAPEFLLRFVPLTTKVHLTNYKPDFMLAVWRDYCPGADALFYFDPDITVLCRWSFLEEWVECGVALCADVNADLPTSHPLRHAWRKYFGVYGVEFTREQSLYFNGGFVGIAKQNAGFLNLWQHLQQLMEPAVGGLQNTGVLDRCFLFNKTDQDALNVAAMACQEPTSCIGRDGMDLEGGSGYIMCHALGGVKPWRKKMLWNTLIKVAPPSRADKSFFRNASSPIRLYGPFRHGLKSLDLFAASAVGRYIR